MGEKKLIGIHSLEGFFSARVEKKKSDAGNFFSRMYLSTGDWEYRRLKGGQGWGKTNYCYACYVRDDGGSFLCCIYELLNCYAPLWKKSNLLNLDNRLAKLYLSI